MHGHIQGNDADARKQAHGRTLTTKEYALSLFIAAQVKAVWGHCYENAYPAFFAFPQMFEPHGLFVEGWIVYEEANRVVLMEHGWLMNDEFLVDPTIVLIVEIGEPVYYFPGVERTGAELLALENEWFPHVRFDGHGEDGMDHPGYRAAYERARDLAGSLMSDGKTFTEIRATHLAPENEAVEQGTPGVRMIFLLPDE